MRCFSKRLLGSFRIWNQRPVERLVRFEVRVRHDLVLYCGFEGANRREWLVVNDDLLGRVDCAVTVVAQHHCNDVADVLCFVDCHGVVRRVDHVFSDWPCTWQWCEPQSHVGELRAGVHRCDTGHCLGFGGVDAVDLCVAHRRADHAHPQFARSVDVIDELVLADEQRGIFLAQHLGSHHRGHEAPPATLCTALTMLW